MRKSTKVVVGFASVGFILPWIFVAFYAIADHFGKYPGTAPLFYLCPSSILSIGLDNASPVVAIMGWLFISASKCSFLWGTCTCDRGDLSCDSAGPTVERVGAAMIEDGDAVRELRTGNDNGQCGDSSLRSE
jgi:hypothetical protein